ncbi:helicase-exonuclease AddAB subunit AddA [Aceticella autotrophica]|uniref:ATP-dependent helicase/nuclease subunit A n=1 Tax=Aceticella autotrophica TaxID=2755338 RepID=A0A975AUY1_9THEO|nr:helicase-exonuclease AddAB subunit AddA [Aceticella autotrophica]QSZ26912.1 helicase-exonuclease AddAB subunit AddA [Aceticella autotrophica]
MNVAKWTKEQGDAINSRNSSLLVSAAAGAGKTAVLVERIIKRITDIKNPVDIDKLLVVTFTDAAASELRERIGNVISDVLIKNPENKRIEAQLKLLCRANISTIHSFCLEVIRNNFHMTDIDPYFRIADDIETDLIKQEAMEELLEEWYDKDNNWDFIILVESYGGSRGDSKLKEIIFDLYNFAKSMPFPEEWLRDKIKKFNIDDNFDFGKSEWGNCLIKGIKIELTGYKNAIEKAISIIVSSDGLLPYLDNYDEELEIIENLIKCTEKSWESLCYAFNNINFKNLKSCKKDADIVAKETVTKIRNEVKTGINKIKEEIFSYTREEIKKEIKSLYPLMKTLCSLVVDFDKKYSMLKKGKNIMDFNDIEHYALNILLRRNEKGDTESTEVAKIYRSKFEEILIDEYQDSNIIQEVILNSISKDNNIFMVGDVKQSIYRFRQAKPELFLEKYKSYSYDQNSEKRKILLNDNFRSRKEIIDSINYIFKNIMSKEIGELDYNDEEMLNYSADFPEIEEEVKTELHIIENKAYTKNEEVSSEEDDSEDEPIENIRLEAKMVAKRIKQLISPDENGLRLKVYDKNIQGLRALKYRDIVILLRSVSDRAPIFLEELSKSDIPAYADAGLGYFETPEIKMIISLLQVIDNPMQDIPLIAVLNSPIFEFTPDDLVDVRLEDVEGAFYRALLRASLKNDVIGKKAKHVIECIEKWREKALNMPIDELIRYLYEETGYYGYVGTMEEGTIRQANLRILLIRAKEYEDTSFKGLFNFINYINKLKYHEEDMASAKVLGENENVVRIMSVHKSKGLEFPVVFVSDIGKKFNLKDLKKPVLFHYDLGFGPEFVDCKKRIFHSSIVKEAVKKQILYDTLSEEMRILYVALTRCRERLIITGSSNDVEKDVARWGRYAIGGKLSIYNTLRAKNYLDWICPVILKHKDGKALREYLQGNIDLIDDTSKWEVRVWQREFIINDEKAVNEDIQNILDELKGIKNARSKFADEVDRRLQYKYPFEKSTVLPAKLTVTEVKKLLNDDMSTFLIKSSHLKKPAFLDEKKDFSAAEKGTFLHLVMQKLDFSKVKTENNIKEQIELMVRSGILAESQAKTVDTGKILAFLCTPVGIRMKNAEKLYREIPFLTKIKATEIYKDLTSEYENEYILLQGKIDCYFEEDGGLVLIDYKTDYVTKDNLDSLKNEYKIQIELYSKSLEYITGKKVKERYIYFFSTWIDAVKM